MIEQLETLIKERLQFLNPINLIIIDDSDKHIGHAGHKKGKHLRLHIESDVFNNLKLIERHRIIYESLADLMDTKIHALSIKAITPK